MSTGVERNAARNFREERDRVEAAIRRAVAAALRRHKLLGQAVAIERDGQIITIPPEQIRDDGTADQTPNAGPT